MNKGTHFIGPLMYGQLINFGLRVKYTPEIIINERLTLIQP